jgi:hypothetical protein
MRWRSGLIGLPELLGLRLLDALLALPVSSDARRSYRESGLVQGRKADVLTGKFATVFYRDRCLARGLAFGRRLSFFAPCSRRNPDELLERAIMSRCTPPIGLPVDGIAKKIEVIEFVSQKSGVQQYYAGPNGQDFDSLKAFFTQPIKDPGAARTCPGPPAPAQAKPPKPAVPALLPNPIITDHTQCYTDTNFGIMRLLLPRFAATSSNDPATLANSYVKIVQDKVLKPVSVSAACKSTGPTALPYSLNPGQPGWDWGDLTNVCGDWGWFLSVDDYFKVLTSLASGDGKIISNCQLRDMEINHALADPSQFQADHGIGWDLTTTTLPGAKDPIRWLEKNGADSGFGSGKGGT